jgi:hypothetical protein
MTWLVLVLLGLPVRAVPGVTEPSRKSSPRKPSSTTLVTVPSNWNVMESARAPGNNEQACDDREDRTGSRTRESRRGTPPPARRSRQHQKGVAVHRRWRSIGERGTAPPEAPQPSGPPF